MYIEMLCQVKENVLILVFGPQIYNGENHETWFNIDK